MKGTIRKKEIQNRYQLQINFHKTYWYMTLIIEYTLSGNKELLYLFIFQP